MSNLFNHEHAACCGRFQWWREAYSSERKPFAQPGTVRRYAPDMAIAVAHLKLELSVLPEQKTLSGTATTRVEAIAPSVAKVFFEAREMQVTGARLSGSSASLSIEKTDNGFFVVLPSPLSRGEQAELLVDYRVVHPRAGIYFTGPSGLNASKPVQIWTQGQDEDANYWFPVAGADYPNHKMTSEVIVTVPAQYIGLSNGKLVSESKDEAAGTRSFHWLHDKPHVSYLVTLVVGEFEKFSESYKGMPVDCYAHPSRSAEAKVYAKGTADLVALYSRLYGVEYPWNGKYAQVLVQDFMFGGMENTTLSTITDTMMADISVGDEYRRAQLRLNAHELNHHWWGDLVTCRDWSHAWLNEGGATYGEVEAMESVYGKKERDYYVKIIADQYFAEDRSYRRPIVTNLYKEPIDLFDRHLYQKGGLVRHMLRYVLGDEGYYRSMKQFLNDNAFQPADTHDFIKAIEKATGKNLREFFDQWVFGAGFPEYRVGYRYDDEGKIATVKVAQTQKVEGDTGLFKMPIRLSFTLDDGSVIDHTVTVSEADHSFSFTMPSRPRMFRFDPENWVLKKLNLSGVPKEMLICQLSEDPDLMGRVHAADAIAAIGGLDAVQALESAVKSSIHWGVQVEAAAALGKIATPAARQALEDSLANKEPRVRRAVVSALGNFKDDSVAERLARVVTSGKEKSIFVIADAAMALGKTKASPAFDALSKALEMDSWNETIRIAAISGLAELGTKEAAELISGFTGADKPATARPAAINALGRLARVAPAAVDTLHKIAASEEASQFRLSMALVSALGEAKNPESRSYLSAIAGMAVDGRVKRAVELSMQKLSSASADKAPDAATAKRIEELEARVRALSEAHEHAALVSSNGEQTCKHKGKQGKNKRGKRAGSQSKKG